MSPHIIAIRTMLPACMGGFCAQRDHCERHVTPIRALVVERLCQRGRERAYPMPQHRFGEEAAP